ncbi:MAG: DNA translocase FtsK [Syntrophomonadaceae bacterium]|jgi:S-DNA-T family DNA segregation ATPase FtsK/SpoIIIE|nr:DNA translocase FtsK [Syntrophomonadaceae bacterium]
MKKNGKTAAAVQKKKVKSAAANTSAVSRVSKEILSLVVFMLSVFLYIGLEKFTKNPEASRFIGIVGTNLLSVLQTVFGAGALAIAFFLLGWSAHLGILKSSWSIRMWGGTLLLITILMSLSLWKIPMGLSAWEAGVRGMGGGYLGGALATISETLLGGVGSIFLVVLLALISLMMLINKPMAIIASFLLRGMKKGKIILTKFLYEESDIDDEVSADKKNNADWEKKEIALNITGGINDIPEEGLPAEGKQEARIFLEPRFTEKEEENNGVYGTPEVGLLYQKPPMDLLSGANNDQTIDKNNIKESITLLEETFANFSIGVKVNQVNCGPAVTRYELSPAPGVKISKILSLADDIQLSLAAPGIRLEAPIPGKSAIGIEVPNKKILSVGLRQLLSSPQFKKLDSALALALGEDITGNPVVAKLNEFPHLLVAGSTGSGKSVCLNCIIMSFLFNATPDELKMVFIDPKMVELTIYNGIPHLLYPVVTDSKKAAVILKWMVAEMEKRYKLFADQGVRDIYRYNQLGKEKLPFIVIVIDELADLMMVSPVEVEDAICRLAQMARAAGMHLIVATQRPSVDVVTGIIKANIPSRIAFAVSSQADSRTILDSGGAEKLLGKGDMLFLPVGANKPYRVQGAFVSDGEIEKTARYVCSQVDMENQREELLDMEMAFEDDEAGDELFWEAVGTLVEAKKASVSFLQRRLRIGYSRAARLVDMMEERGIVSSPDSNKKREILIDREQLEKLQERKSLTL